MADLPFYTEGPVCDTEGNIFITAPAGEQIYQLHIDGSFSRWSTSGWPNGQAILDNGDHLICDSKLGVIRRFNPYGAWVADETKNFYNGQVITSPNDLAVLPNGGIYFTDSVRHQGSVWFKDPSGKQEIVADGLDYPNGIVFCMERNCLFVAESYRNRILKITLERKGKNNVQVFADLPVHPSGNEIDNLPDGMDIDNNGNLWIAHYGMGAIQVLSAEGKLLHSIDTHLPLTSNIFLTAGKAIITGGYAEPGPGAVMIVYR
ncbi:MAG: SMP-30/gluconolactonase/LRE family protein [Chitinophagaceae bacterium]|nr:SMP-30/gluconolactonase/LRE family protein [Chitinophagaceae bacterium]